MTTTPSPSGLLWALRIGVVVTGVTVGLALTSAADGRHDGAGLPAAVVWWAVVAVQVMAVVVPGALGLTVVRAGAPLAPVAAAGALVAGASPAIGAAALASALAATAIAFAAEIGVAMVQGAAYGHERRFPLRAPAALQLPVAAAWLVWAGLVVGTVVLLGSRQWVVGAVLAVATAGSTWFFGQRAHHLSRRWLVVVPAGVVVHDHVVLGETLMVPTANVKRCSLAFADTEALDLTGPAAGHALEVKVGEMVTPLLAATRSQPRGTAIHAASFLVAPSRPGRALAALTAAGVPTG